MASADMCPDNENGARATTDEPAAATAAAGRFPQPHGTGDASRWVQRWSHLVAPGGAVLDVASGAGRHARWFASRGHPVTALDRDAAALAAMADDPRITTRIADLENAPWPLPGLASVTPSTASSAQEHDTVKGQKDAETKFAAVIVTNYLHRPLFPQLLAALAPGGVLIYETFAQGNERVGKPSNPAFLLAPGELLDVVRPALRVIAFQDGFLAQPRPAYIQRICAIREAEQLTDPTGDSLPRCYELAG
ncbi:SAM-dependent methyltransferase [Paraburkholderia sp.]|uniref:class I SAM-dependent methyltransferase n=1 Tax=Paraburkholderia sp. TaxID=1926495 RepID=UPI002389AC0D|nr:SAM-dependent methyltransferase [Paraburkholderia sp.]MDE1183950.1 SAM-dependent methyltransferase [Paraburkholderia sp.]